MHRSHKLATMSSYSGGPLRLFPNEPSRIRLCRTVPRMLAYLATTWRSRQYALLTIPENKNASTVMNATSIPISGSKNAKIQPSEATWQSSPRTRNAPGPRAHCAHAASPKRAPMTNCGYRPERVRPREHKRLDSHVRHFSHDLLQKKKKKKKKKLRHSHKKMRYALPLDILANTTSPKLAT